MEQTSTSLTVPNGPEISSDPEFSPGFHTGEARSECAHTTLVLVDIILQMEPLLQDLLLPARQWF